MGWGFIWLMFILKIPLIGLLYIVWWAIKQENNPLEERSDGGNVPAGTATIRVTAWSTCCRERVNAGRMRTMLPLASGLLPRMRPLSRQRSVNSRVARGDGRLETLSSTNSIPSLRPSPRTEPTTSKRSRSRTPRPARSSATR